ncbi:chemotaxis protein CheW [Defluviimonas sp. WL0024]|uniref:Chemotaxis protein CheW n=2 Tax=Albidovulum TaxID=205889 RepID=A0ABT3IXE6_9RHOB|nr:MULTISPECIES: chemotaxis protein CheW [Defluviimonas]MCU9846537.1 chemotaxis protein CheW [Defluviimonas sp. WL0024]MCW3780116.1 chemotaxis protein CheW [Defluviimonas salinarum]
MTDAAPEEVKLLTFCVGAESFCLDIMAVRELRTWSPPTPLPHAPSYLSGVINLRGTILPVLDLAARLGLPSVEATERHVIIVVETASQSAGLVVEAVHAIRPVARDLFEPMPPAARNGSEDCLASLALVGGQMVRVIDVSAILTDRRAFSA